MQQPTSPSFVGFFAVVVDPSANVSLNLGSKSRFHHQSSLSTCFVLCSLMFVVHSAAEHVKHLKTFFPVRESKGGSWGGWGFPRTALRSHVAWTATTDNDA